MVAPRVNSQKYQPVCSGLEIPRRGRSPDFVHRGTALPSFPVALQAAPVHSDCIVPDSHRILYSPPYGGTSAIQFYIFSDIADYKHPPPICQRGKNSRFAHFLSKRAIFSRFPLCREKEGASRAETSSFFPFSQRSALSHSASLKPGSAKSSPMSSGRLTSIPSVASSANCSSSDIAGSLSLSPSSL